MVARGYGEETFIGVSNSFRKGVRFDPDLNRSSFPEDGKLCHCLCTFAGRRTGLGHSQLHGSDSGYADSSTYAWSRGGKESKKLREDRPTALPKQVPLTAGP